MFIAIVEVVGTKSNNIIFQFMMKNFYALLVAMFVALTASADHGTPLYIVGGGDFVGGEWNPRTPDEFVYDADKDVYTYYVTNLTSFCFSSTKREDGTADDAWDAFDVGRYSLENGSYGKIPGVWQPLTQQSEVSNNIETPWKGDYTITVDGACTSVMLTTTTPKQIVLYLRGDMNTWQCSTSWQFTRLSENVYKFVCADGQKVSVTDRFKIADEDFNENYTFGGFGYDDYLTAFDQKVALCNDNYGCSMQMPQEFTGVCYLQLSPSIAYFSNDKTAECPFQIGDEPVINGAPLYIYYADRSDSNVYLDGEQLTYNADKQEYTYAIKNLSSFQISTTKLPEGNNVIYAENAWNVGEFSAKSIWTTDNVSRVYLVQNNSNPYFQSWKRGDYTITVSGDLSLMTLEVTPVDYAGIYLRGDMNRWNSHFDWEMEALSDNVYKYECEEGHQISAHQAFKFADSSWGAINVGFPHDALTDYVGLEEQLELLNFDNPENMIMSEDFNGVCYLQLKPTRAYFSNDKSSPCPFGLGDESFLDDVEVFEESLPVQYFNLQGQRVDNPSQGVYIRVEGAKATKVVL